MNKRPLFEELKRMNEIAGIMPVNEDSSSSGIEFITPIKGSQVWAYKLGTVLNLPDDEVDTSFPIDDQEVVGKVYWRLETDLHDYGIRSMKVVIRRVEININWSHYGINDQEQKGFLKFDTNLPEFKDWKLDNEMVLSPDGAILPRQVEIEFHRKTATII